MLDAEKFISEVEKYPLLYDHRANNRRNKAARFKCWSAIGQAMFENWNTLTQDVQEERSKLLNTKWKLFRDCFVRDYREVRKYESEGGPPPKKSKYLYYDRLRFLAPYLYKGVGYKTPPDDFKPLDDAMPPDDQKPLDDVNQLLEIVYGEDGELDDNSKPAKSPTVRTSGTPEESAPADKFKLKCMRIKLPEKWTSDKNATKSTDGTRIPEELANERETMHTVTPRSAVTSNATITSASTAQNSNFLTKFRPIFPKIDNPVPLSLQDSVPMHYDESYRDKHGNKAFLLSFVPIMDSLPPHMSLQARLRITEVFNGLVSNSPPEQGFYAQI